MKLTDDGVICATGTRVGRDGRVGVIPVRAICDVEAALLKSDRAAVRVPDDVGVKVTFTVVVSPAASVTGKAGEVYAKSEASGPAIVISETTRAPAPVLVIRMGAEALVVFSG